MVTQHLPKEAGREPKVPTCCQSFLLKASARGDDLRYHGNRKRPAVSLWAVMHKTSLLKADFTIRVICISDFFSYSSFILGSHATSGLSVYWATWYQALLTDARKNFEKLSALSSHINTRKATYSQLANLHQRCLNLQNEP